MSENCPTQPEPVVNSDQIKNQSKRPSEQFDASDLENEGNKRARTSGMEIGNNVNNNVGASSNVMLHHRGLTQTTNTPSSVSAIKSIVHLSVTQVKPSYTEPWRKMFPVSLTGTGILFDWDTYGMCHRESAASDQATGTGIAAADSSKNAKSLRILTTASVVNHATSIRASMRSSLSPASVSCVVEWISLPMDLAMLKLETTDAWNGGNHTIISGRLPELGEQVKIVGFSTLSPTLNRSNIPNNIGTVSNYFADEEQQFMLRMEINTSATQFDSGIVVDQFGHVVGLISSDSAVIPAIAIHQFISWCSGNASHVVQESDDHTAFTAHTHESDATSVRGETDHESCTHSHVANVNSNSSRNQPKNRSGGQRSILPGIASLGITGYQTLENKAIRLSFGADVNGVDGVRITGVYHIAHSIINSNYDTELAHCNKMDGHCLSSMLKVDDILLSINGEPVMFDGTVKLAAGRDDERVNFQWLISRCKPDSLVQLEVIRQKKHMRITATVSEPKYLVSRLDEQNEELPSYVVVGGCVFVPLSHAWISESHNTNPTLPVDGYHRYLQEQRRGDQQLIILSHVLADDINLGYHSMRNLLLTSVNGHKLNNLKHLVDILVKDKKPLIEFRCSGIHSSRAKLGESMHSNSTIHSLALSNSFHFFLYQVISMQAKDAMNSETSILSRHMIDSWCSPNARSLALKKESERKAHRHGVTCGLKTLRALRNAISETTIVVHKPKTVDERAISTTKRILHLSEEHKMQSAPNFSGKYIEDVGWTQVKTKHLSQLCVCGKSTRFYCICR